MSAAPCSPLNCPSRQNVESQTKHSTDTTTSYGPASTADSTKALHAASLPSMNCTRHLLRSLRAASSGGTAISRSSPQFSRTAARASVSRTAPTRRISSTVCRSNKTPSADDPNFVSIVDLQPQTVRAGKRHGPGIILLGSLPATYNY